MNGYHGKVLVIDLGEKSWRHVAIPENILRSYIGGTGLSAWLLYQLCPEGADPLGPDNPLIFSTSPLVDTKLTTSSKFAVTSKSPLTGYIGDSMSSSKIAVSMKRTGCDAVVLKGQASNWTYLVVSDDNVDFRSAEDLVGLNSSDTESKLRQMLEPGVSVACIGPAGESLVRYSTISNDGGRQAGRTGTGAVMGSKNLKAIVFEGNKKVGINDNKSLDAIRVDLIEKSLGSATTKYRETGTIANASVFDRLGSLPSNNFKNASFKDLSQITAENIYQETTVRSVHCANCTIGCEKLITDPGTGSEVRLEYQSLFALGPLVGSGDRSILLESAKYCDEVGLDTVSAGATIAWYFECIDKGFLKDEFVHSSNKIMDILRAIVSRKGIGDLLAEGTKFASATVKRGSSDFAMHVKGLEMPGYEPRTLKTMALALAVSTRGACHNRSSAYEYDFSSVTDRFKADTEKGDLVAKGEDYSAVMDSMIWCKFVRKVFSDFYVESAEILATVTGWDIDAEELEACGERINNLKKMFNMREGWVRMDDTLPHRVLNESLEDGNSLSKEELNLMIDAYYRARNWNKDGTIPFKTLKRLNIDQVPDVVVS